MKRELNAGLRTRLFIKRSGTKRVSSSGGVSAGGGRGGWKRRDHLRGASALTLAHVTTEFLYHPDVGSVKGHASWASADRKGAQSGSVPDPQLAHRVI